jgi:nucleoredoxin
MGKNFEVIFVSSDRDERAFDEYRDEMPWLAMPFRDRELKAKLSKTFKVTGIPSLVVLDETGSVITTDGRRVALDVEKFPWTPPGVDEVLGDAFVRNDATKSAVTLRDIISTRDGEGKYAQRRRQRQTATKGDKYVGIYFSAHWCGPCRQFTPKLKAAYESLRARGIDFEVIFVSSDRSEEEFTNYQSESMPDWLAVPFSDAERRAALAEHFKVTGIPRFAMLDGDLNVVNPDARAIAARDDETFSALPLAPAAGGGRRLRGDGRGHQRHAHAGGADGGVWGEVGFLERGSEQSGETKAGEGKRRRLASEADALRRR